MFPLRQIHQIEITSRCNLRCKYCVHPTMARAKQDMDRETYTRALDWVKHFQAAGTQGDLNLAGIGESTMHEAFIEYLALAREALGPRQVLVLATNGIRVDDAMARAMQPYYPKVFVSLHRPERAGPAINALRRVGLLAGMSADPSIAATDWAGQVKWEVTTPVKGAPCPWVRGGWGMVLVDGRITRCSFDGTGVGVFGDVWQDVPALSTSPYKLCTTCHQDVGVAMNEGLKEAV